MMWDFNDSWMHGSAFGGWFMFIGLLVVLAAAIVLVVYAIRATTNQRDSVERRAYAVGPGTAASPPFQAPAQESPRDILKRRYAAGEIDRDEYLQKLADL